MKSYLLISGLLTSLAFSTGALANDDCTDPVADWQPREVLQKQLEERGWMVRRIKVDDGCYEAKGIDNLGNKFEAEYYPATLRIRKLEIKFNQEGNAADYLDKNPDQKTD